MLRDLRWLSALAVISRVSSVVTVPLLTTALVPAEYGLYRSVLLATSTILIVRGLPNLNSLLQKRLPELDTDTRKGGLVSAATLVQLSLVVTGVAGLAALDAAGALDIVSGELQRIVRQHFRLVVVLTLAKGLLGSLLPVAQGTDRFRLYSGVRIFRELFVLIALAALFALGELTVLTALLVYALAEGGSAVVLVATLRSLLWTRPEFVHLRRQFVDISLPLVPHSLLKSLGGRIPDILVLATFGSATFGLWSVLFAFTNVFQLFSKPFSNMLIPEISNRVDGDRPLDQLVKKYYKTMVLLCTPLVVGGWLVGPQVVRYVFGSEYVISSATMGVFLLAFGIQTVDTLGGAMFIGTGESARETVRFGISLVFRLTFVVLGTLVFQSLLVVGVGYVLENLFMTAVSLRYQRGLVQFSTPQPLTVVLFLADLTLMAAAVALLEPYVQNTVTVVAVVGSGAAVYFTSLLLSGMLSDDDIRLIKRFVGS